MKVSDEHVAALRTLLAGDFDEHDRALDILQQRGNWEPYNTLIQAAFFEAVDRRFGKGYTVAEIVQFVADARSRFDQSGSDVDARVAERLILAAQGEGLIPDLDTNTVVGTEVLLLGAMMTDERLDSAGLDEFMQEARDLADEWMATG